MSGNPVEANVVTRFVLGFAVIFSMMIGGQAVGVLFESLHVPYGNWVGAAVGAVLVFVAFAVLYRRYNAAYAE